jgi:hypothetical protein
MFEKFNDIRRASAAYYAKNEGKEGVVRSSVEMLDEMLVEFEDEDFMNKKTRMLIEALPKIDQIELTGLAFYGRDAAVTSETRESVLAEWTSYHAYMVNEEGHASYLSAKPLHLFLDRAEAKLKGQMDTKPGADEYSDDYDESHGEEHDEG